MASITNNIHSMENKRFRVEARKELSYLDSADLIGLILDTAEVKTLSVMTTSLKVARERGDRESALLRSTARRTGS